MRFNIDGVKYDVEDSKGISAMDLKQELNDYDEGVTEIRDSTELGDSLKELNNDNMEKGTRMSGIDMRSRLHYTEVSGILAVDALVTLKFLPVSILNFTRQKKRLAVSLGGKGRDDIVSIVAGKREQDAKTGMSVFDRVKSTFGGGSKKGGNIQ